MRKLILGAVCVLSMVAVTACGSEPIALTQDNVKGSAIAVTNKGTVQSSLVEEFDKEYYDVDELKTFIEDDLKEFNSENNANVTLNFVTSKNKKAYVVFDYASLEEYSTYSGATLTLMSGEEAKKSDAIDTQISKYGKSSKKDKSSAIKKKYKALIIDNSEGNLSEEVEISVEGKIKFSSNVSKVDENTAKYSKLDSVAVVVYDPY